ncbi:RNA-binding transcriptional accessory protein [bacterium]|nr:RNA-binding transcriptional accessory protein [bacterium]
MNNISILAKNMNIKESQIEAVLKLLEEGATIPFIARYRKEATGSLDEEQIRQIEKEYTYLQNLLKRKEDVIRLITEKDMMTEDLQRQIMACEKLTDVEDLYRPFKEKKKTKASEAIKMGLEPLAKKIMAFPTKGSLSDLAKEFPYDLEVSLTGAKYIISEWISDNAYYRKLIKNEIFYYGSMESKLKKNASDERLVYKMYYDFSEPIRYAKHYRVLAMNRGEKEDVLAVNLSFDKDKIMSLLEEKIIKNKDSFVVDEVKEALKDSLKRLIFPSVEREIRAELTEKAESKAILTFQDNLEHLLMTKPIKEKTVLGFDPAFRTGCKLAVLNPYGNVLEIATIYPHEPKNEKEKSAQILKNLIDKYKVQIIAIGNGTASRESEAFVASTIKNTPVLYNLVSEAGASVYSASPLAISEFPDLTVEKRSAISIGRRIQDPLSELVKIDPKSIGVGEYQHDVNQKELNEALSFTVGKIVNEIGVNLNTASASILKYISGLSKKTIDSILKFRETKPFTSREEIKSLSGFSDKVYEQAIGFLRIIDGKNPLDKTRIHPESYDLVSKLLNYLHLNINDLDKKEFKETLQNVDIKKLVETLDCDKYTLEDIIEELQNPGQDYRDKLDDIVLKSDVLTIKDLKVGMELKGTVRNVTSFGAFVDIGLHDDGLIHISKMSKSFVKNPSDILSVGDIITVYVCDIDLEKEKVQLSLFKD